MYRPLDAANFASLCADPSLDDASIKRILIYQGEFNPPNIGHARLLKHAFFKMRRELNLVCAVVFPLPDDEMTFMFRNEPKKLLLTQEQRAHLWSTYKQDPDTGEPDDGKWFFINERFDEDVVDELSAALTKNQRDLSPTSVDLVLLRPSAAFTGEHDFWVEYEEDEYPKLLSDVSTPGKSLFTSSGEMKPWPEYEQWHLFQITDALDLIAEPILPRRVRVGQQPGPSVKQAVLKTAKKQSLDPVGVFDRNIRFHSRNPLLTHDSTDGSSLIRQLRHLSLAGDRLSQCWVTRPKDKPDDVPVFFLPGRSHSASKEERCRAANLDMCQIISSGSIELVEWKLNGKVFDLELLTKYIRQANIQQWVSCISESDYPYPEDVPVYFRSKSYKNVSESDYLSLILYGAKQVACGKDFLGALNQDDNKELFEYVLGPKSQVDLYLLDAIKASLKAGVGISHFARDCEFLDTICLGMDVDTHLYGSSHTRAPQHSDLNDQQSPKTATADKHQGMSRSAATKIRVIGTNIEQMLENGLASSIVAAGASELTPSEVRYLDEIFWKNKPVQEQQQQQGRHEKSHSFNQTSDDRNRDHKKSPRRARFGASAKSQGPQDLYKTTRRHIQRAIKSLTETDASMRSDVSVAGSADDDAEAAGYIPLSSDDDSETDHEHDE